MNYDVLQHCTIKLVRARRDYRCCETGRKIVRGELHWVTKGLSEDGWRSFRECQGSRALRHQIVMMDKIRGIYFGGLLEYVRESCDPVLERLWANTFPEMPL